jgi:hypothetical protein
MDRAFANGEAASNTEAENARLRGLIAVTPENVERVARVMFTYDGVCSPHDWDNANEVARTNFRELATAALNALAPET